MADEKDETTDMATPEEMQEVLDDETPLPSRQEIEEEEVTPVPQTGLNLATLRDRIAAGIFDALMMGYLYLGLLLGYNYVVFRQLLRPIPTQGTHAIVFNSLFLLFGFLYFFISEFVFYTSLGKFFCHLSVRNKMGEGATLFQVALRNILRPLDTLLLIFPTWIFLEKTPKRQRLGDLLAGTVIMKHYSSGATRLPVLGRTASGTLRLISGTIDLVFALGWMGGIALFIDYQRPVLSFLVTLLLPFFYLLWHVVWETVFQTTIGQSIFGLKIAQEDGAPIGFTQAMIRAVFRLLDTNPFGWVTFFVSNKNQRPADLAAGTVVVHAKRSWKVLIGFGVSLLAIAGIWYAGLANPRSYLTPFFKLNFLNSIFSVKIGGGRTLPEEQGLFVKRFSYLLPDHTTPRPSAEFKPGDTVYFSFDVTGFAMRTGEVWLEEDLSVVYPDNNIGFRQENIVDFHQLLKNPETPLEIMNTLALPPNAQPGHYTLTIILHDRFADRHLTEQRTFLVNAP